MRRCRWVLPVVFVALLAGCVGGDDDGSLSMDSLDGAGDECPVDLDAAVADAGLGEEGADVEVVVEGGSGEGDGDASAIDQVGGLYVECTRSVGDGGGEVASYVFASEQPQAISLLLPLIQQDLDLRIEDVESIFERFGATEPGSLVDLGVDGPGAVAPIDVADAASAVLYVSAADGGASPAQVRTIAQHILDGL